MSLACFIADCGGIQNVTRVLIPDDDLVFEVRDIDLVTGTPPSMDDVDGQTCVGIDRALGQVRYKKPATLTSADLLAVGKQIANQQRGMAQAREVVTECEFRPQWHVSPPQGLLNDPNGFVFHNGQYHLFYQWSPHSCEHKDKYWAHLVSKDMLDWQGQPIALTPSDWFDSHGVFSGHAVSHGDELMLFYTGNTRIGEQRDRHTTQCLAVSTDGVTFDKKGPVVATLPPQVTPHCRDPKVFYHNNEWLMLLGAQREDLRGRLAVYKSNNLHDWVHHGLYGEEMGDFGYMWECPDMFQLNGRWVALIGPQGIASTSPHHTVPHHNGYVDVELSDEQGITFSGFKNLDHGFDFYAPQTLATPDGRRVLVGWMGLPDEINQPSIDNGWIHQLTGLRELTYQDERLIQRPLQELKSMRSPVEVFELNHSSRDLGTKSFELQVELEWGSEFALFKDSHHELKIILDADTHTLLLDRSQTLIREGDQVRELSLSSSTVTLQILADSSSVEIFINDGEYVMTSRVFTPLNATSITLSGCATFSFWRLALPKLNSASSNQEGCE